MSEISDNETPENGEESFAEMFESYSSDMTDDISVGDKIQGKVIAIGATSVFVDTGTKVDGVVDKGELTDEDGRCDLAVDDVLELYVVEAGESEIRLSKAISGIGGLNLLNDAWENRIPVEGKVIQSIKGGFHIEVIKRRAFCPISQIDIAYVETPEDYVGKTFQFLIKQFAENGKNIVVSRRVLLQKEQDAARDAFLKELSMDTVYQSEVVRIMPFGAFVALAPGVEGLVHISELSWSRLEKPEDAVRIGDVLPVKVLSVQDGDKPGRKKISLSSKQATKDPWDTIGDRFSIGDKIKGKVTRCMGFGVFVEIEAGVEGLVHISEMSYTKRITRTEDEVSPGEDVFVMIKELDPYKKRISLSMKDAEGDPWVDIEGKYTIGQTVEGKIEKKEPFGYFINLEPGVTGLLPKSKISASENTAGIEKLKQGDTMAVTVDTINTADRKISLGTGDAAETGDWKQYAGTSSGSFGDLGDKLAQAFSKKNKR